MLPEVEAPEGPQLRAVGLMYDGEHHLLRDQRDKDSGITATLTAAGLPVLRVTAEMIRDHAAFLGFLRPLLARLQRR